MSEVPPGGLINLPNDFRVKQLEEIFKHAVDIQVDHTLLEMRVLWPRSKNP